MNLFLLSEIIGRKLTKEFLNLCKVTKQKASKGQFNRVDYYFRLNNKTAVVEIKVRDLRYKDYDTHLIEVSKVKALLEDKNKKKLNCAFLFFYFGNNFLYIYKAEDVINKVKILELYCNTTTSVYKGKVPKQVYLIPTNLAYKFEKVDNLWKKSNN